MEIGLVGLGKMGFNLALNLHRNGIRVLAYDINPDAGDALKEQGITVFRNLGELCQSMNARRVIWLMVPAGRIVDDTISLLEPHLSASDILIDGGNSHYKDSMRRASDLAKKNIDFLDCGTSGGTSGALNGICAMIGGVREVFNHCESIFKSVSVPNGYLYCGAPGSGHYTKMVHNGIEYGMMQSIAEGFELMEKSGFEFNHAEVARLWNNGSVIRGWLMELTESAFSKDARLDKIKGVMHSSGEGKWMLETALEKNIPTPVVALSLMMRYRSQEEDTFSGKIVAALRYEFGGHAVEKK